MGKGKLTKRLQVSEYFIFMWCFRPRVTRCPVCRFVFQGTPDIRNRYILRWNSSSAFLVEILDHKLDYFLTKIYVWIFLNEFFKPEYDFCKTALHCAARGIVYRQEPVLHLYMWFCTAPGGCLSTRACDAAVRLLLYYTWRGSVYKSLSGAPGRADYEYYFVGCWECAKKMLSMFD